MAVFLLHGSEDAGELAMIGHVIKAAPVLDLLDGELTLCSGAPLRDKQSKSAASQKSRKP
jgi:hypothetical protein